MKKRILAMLTATMMVLGLAACGATDTKDGAGDTSAAGSSSSGDLIKVGIINNDPNESGYRTANDKDMKNMFTKENGYDASFAYSLKNDEQITAAQKFIQDGVDYLLLSAMFRIKHFHVCFPQRRNRSYILPVSVEMIGIHLSSVTQKIWNDIVSKIILGIRVCLILDQVLL